MRHLLTVGLSLALVLGLGGLAGAQTSERIAARNVKKAPVKPVVIRGRSQTVVITPRYLTAGTAVSPGETRGAVLGSDPRYFSTGRNISGFDEVNLRRDPFYLPYPQSSIAFDSPWGSKLPNER